MKKRIMLFTLVGLGSSLMLTGCIGGPTYGTDKSSSNQLIDDISGIASLGNINKTKKIDTKPRPDLVPPSSNTSVSNLPPPQENVVRSGTPDWPESPEERRQRIRNEATANQNNPNYRSKVKGTSASDENLPYLPDGVNRRRERESFMPSAQETKKQRADYLARQKSLAGGDAQQRKYLSEPPLDYRQPAATAPIGETGETEAQKERDRKKEMSGKKGWWPF